MGGGGGGGGRGGGRGREAIKLSLRFYTLPLPFLLHLVSNCRKQEIRGGGGEKGSNPALPISPLLFPYSAGETERLPKGGKGRRGGGKETADMRAYVSYSPSISLARAIEHATSKKKKRRGELSSRLLTLRVTSYCCHYGMSPISTCEERGGGGERKKKKKRKDGGSDSGRHFSVQFKIS